MKIFRAAGLVCLWGLLEAQAQAPIRFKTRTMDPRAEAAVRREPPARSGRASHLLVQFPRAPEAADLAGLSRAGIRVLRAVPDNGLVVAVPPGTDLAALVAGEPAGLGQGVYWVGWLDSGDKLSPALDPAAPGYVVIFHDDVDDDAARRLVTDAGFDLLGNPDLLPHQLLVTGPYERIGELAQWDEVAYILPASPDLVSGNPVIACAGALSGQVQVAEYVKVSQGWPKTNGSVDLRYVFSTITSRLSDSTVRSEVTRALSEWGRYAPVNFTAGTDAAAARTVAIQFARGAHGDAYPFDGPGGVLAHTFFPSPPNPEPLAGDLHLDDDESWNVGKDVDLFTVALHEAGHALGLGHSDRPTAVMYPYYRLTTGLTADDIAGIRDLYGSRDEAPPPTAQPPSTPSSGTPPSAGSPPSAGTPPSTGSPPAGGTPAPGTPDTVPPSLKITSPAFTIVATSAAVITCSGTAADNVGVVSVKWSTSGGASGTATGTTGWTAAAIPLLVGSNTLTFRAFDAAGNSSWRAITVVRR